MKRSLALAMLLSWKVAAADSGTPAVDVGDLPPLPPPTEEQSSTASVLAASTAEEDVVVGADKREQSLGNVASAVTVISGDRLRRFGYRTVGEALAAVAGVYLVDNRLSYSIGIRGLNIPGDFNTRILVLVDGASVNESWGSFAGLGFDSFVSIDDIARVELIRGPVSSVYGANAFFGIVNIVTKNASEQAKVWGKTAFNSITGSVTTAGFAQGDLKKQIRGNVQIVDRIGETTTIPEIPNQSLKGDGGYGFSAGLVGSYKGTFAQVRAYRFRRDSPFAPYLGDAANPEPYFLINTQVLAEGGHTWDVLKKLQVALRGYANLYQYDDKIQQDLVLAETDSPFHDKGTGRTYGAELRGRYELVDQGKLGITAGGEASFNQTESTAFEEDDVADTIKIPKSYDIEGVYAELDGQPTSYFGFTAGARYDRDSAIDTRLSPRAALFLAEPEKYGLKLLYAEGFRNPSAFEAFFFDGVSFVQPTNLHAETIRSFEAVVWAKPASGLSTRLSGFRWDARDLVTSVTLPGDDALQQFQNQGRLVTNGVEAEASYRGTSGWYGFAGGNYSKVGQDDSEGTLHYGNVANAPKWTAGGGLSTPRIANKLHLSSELIYLGERVTRPGDDGSVLHSPGWFGLNLTAYLPNLMGFDVTFGVRNLIGKRDLVVTPGDYDRDVIVPQVPGEGRELYVKVGYAY